MAMPSLSKQKQFIVEHANILNRETKLAILSIVMMEIGPAAIMETGAAKEVDINLDAMQGPNADIVTQIYNIVLMRRKSLSLPAGAAAV